MRKVCVGTNFRLITQWNNRFISPDSNPANKTLIVGHNSAPHLSLQLLQLLVSIMQLHWLRSQSRE